MLYKTEVFHSRLNSTLVAACKISTATSSRKYSKLKSKYFQCSEEYVCESEKTAFS